MARRAKLKLKGELTRAELAEVRRTLAPHKLPKVGVCKALGDGREVCHDPHGYYLVGQKR